MPRGKPVFSDGLVHVMAERCSTCIFRKGAFHLAPGRLKQMIEDSMAEGGGITCHKTINGMAPQEATCRGFVETYGDRVPAIRLAYYLDVIEEV